jgi:nucleoside-triphosphatase THEP1
MISINRAIASLVPYIYALYLPVQSLFLPGFSTRYLEIIALVIYIYSATATLLFFRGLQLPRWQACFNLGAALAMPPLVFAQRELIYDHGIGDWLVMGTAVVLTATAVRQQARLALIGLAVLLTALIVQYGQAAITSVGLAGAIVFVLAGLAVSRGIARATRESENFRAKEIETRSKIAELEASSRERQQQLTQVLGVAVPLLSVIKDSQGPLNDDLRQSAKLVEATLRDNLRGRELLNRAMSNEIQRLRNLGVDVLILDEGGIQSLSAKERDELLSRAVDSLQVVTQGRVTIRSPKGEDFRLTVVATIPGQAQPVLSIRL